MLLLVVLAALAGVIMIAPTAVQQPWLRPSLVRAGLVRAEPGFVELSFTNPQAVDTFVGQSGSLDLDFAVSSHLPATADMRWVVTTTTEGARNAATLKSGSLTLAAGQQRVLHVSGTISCGPKRVEVTVRLSPDGNSSFDASSIHFWVVGDSASTKTVCRIP